MRNALMVSSETGRYDYVRCLLDEGADVDVVNAVRGFCCCLPAR